MLSSSSKKILLAHFSLSSIAFIKLMMLFVDGLYQDNFLSFAIGKIGMKALESGTGKLSIILQYFSGLLFTAVYAALVYALIQFGTARHSKVFAKKIILVGYFLLNAVFIYRLLAAGNNFFHWIGYWLFFTFALPACMVSLPWRSFPAWPRWLVFSLSAVVLLQVWLIFQPMILKPMLIENDYMDISGQTQLKDGAWVDNTRFINEHHIAGIVKYDPRIDQGQTPAFQSGSYVSVTETPLLDKFLEMNRLNLKYHLAYNTEKKWLSVKGKISEQDHLLLSYAFNNPADKQAIDQLYLLSGMQDHTYQRRVYTPQEWDFVEKNDIELTDQGRTGWFFYHHNYFFTPIFAAAQGGDLSKITMVYGWFNTLLFAKLLTWMGGVNYQNYFHLFFSFYPPYYFGFLFLALLIFRRAEYGLLALLVAVAGLMGIGIEPIRLWPGLSPLRHFLDLPVFMCFYFYARGRNLIWLLSAYALSFVALCCSKEFGLFLIGSLSATVIIRAWYERNNFFAAMLSAAAGLLGLIAFLIVPGKNPGYSYMLLGIGSPATPAMVVIVALLFAAVMYYAALLFRHIKDPVNYFWLSVLFYCQFLLVYVLWFPLPHHLFNIAAPLSLLALCFIYLLMRHLDATRNERSVLSVMLMLALLVYVPTAFSFYLHEHKYYRNFVTHKIYHWPFATARLDSTMDPQLFVNAAALIQKYAPADSIYIISKYDTLLPILAGKYSAMPYNELLTNIITTNDVAFLKDFFADKKPEYLFVDRDIKRDFNNDIFMPNDPASKKLGLDQYSASRAATLVVLPEAFAAVSKDYQPVAQSELITVYKRKT